MVIFTNIITPITEVRAYAESNDDLKDYSGEVTVEDEEAAEFPKDGEVIKEGNFALRMINNTEENKLDVNWDKPNESDTFSYRYYQRLYDPNLSEEEQEDFELRSSNYNRDIKVLNIYPNTNSSKVEIPTEFDPDGGINMTYKSNDDFKRDPEGILRRNGDTSQYFYDVIVIGKADLNGLVTVTDEMRNAIEAYIKTGRGVLFGHDTLIDWGSVSNDFDIMKNDNWQYSKLRHYAGVVADRDVAQLAHQSTYIKVDRDGFLLEYPNKLAKDEILKIPLTHVNAALTKGKIWMRLVKEDGTLSDHGMKTPNKTLDYDDGSGMASYESNYYLSTYKNTAQTQAGHYTNSTDDELKIFANTIYFLAQLTKEESLEDYSAMDYAGPEMPNAKIIEQTEDSDTVLLNAKDIGTLYQGKVEALNQTNPSENNLMSDEVVQESKSGIKGYIVDFDKDPEDTGKKDDNGDYIIDAVHLHDEETDGINIKIGKEVSRDSKLMVRAIDNAGNLGELLEIAIKDIEIDISVKQTEAKDEIDNKAQEEKDKIENNDNLSEEEKEAAQDAIDDAVKEAKEDIDNATTEEEVGQAKEDGLLSIVKEGAKAEIIAKGNVKNKEIDSVENPKEEDAQASKTAVETEKTNAIENIGNGKTMEEVDQAKEAGLVAIENVKLPLSGIENAQIEANDEIDNKAAEEKEKIENNDNLSEEEKEAAQDAIDDAVKEVKEDIDNATTEEEVGQAKENGLLAIAKEGAKAAIDGSANAKIKEINARDDVSENGKTEAIGRVNKFATAGKN
ncbi:DUF1542 domain-containing protein, partial [Anaerosphaera multitolerans]